MEFIVTLLVAACGGLVLGMMVSRFLPSATRRILRGIPYILFTLTLANKSWIGDENPLILFPFFIAGFMLCYGGAWYSRLVTGAVFFSLLEPLCMMVDTVNFKHISGLADEITILLCKLAVCILLWGMSCRIVPRRVTLSLSKKLWGLIGGLALAPLFTTLSFSIWKARDFGYEAYQTIAQRIAYTALPFTMLSAFALLVAIAVLSRHGELEQREKLAEIQAVYYQGLQREQMGVRTLRHDMNNHIAAAQVLLEQGDTVGARRYLDKLSQSSALTDGKRYCEHDIANAVISGKAALMNQDGIQADIEVSLPHDLAFPALELCALLGNALDNAMEAAINADQKQVVLRARADRGMFMMRVENTLAQVPRRKNNGFVTNKIDTLAHGLGFAGMQDIARRHGGMCEAENTQTEFTLLVSIPLEH